MRKSWSKPKFYSLDEHSIKSGVVCNGAENGGALYAILTSSSQSLKTVGGSCSAFVATTTCTAGPVKVVVPNSCVASVCS